MIIAFLVLYFLAKAVQSVARQHKQRMAALEREQTRQARIQAQLAREQERQRKAQERFEREQIRQAEQLRKHEEQIAKLEYRMAEAEADIETQTNRIAQLYALLDVAEAAQAAAVPGSAADEKAQRRIITLESQITAAEKKLRKAQFDHATAKAKLSA